MENKNSIIYADVLNIYGSISRWAVPIFVMITGMLLLSPEKNISIQTIFSKYIKRIFIILVFWVIIYALVTQMVSSDEFDIKILANKIINSHYHLWYLYTLIF